MKLTEEKSKLDAELKALSERIAAAEKRRGMLEESEPDRNRSS